MVKAANNATDGGGEIYPTLSTIERQMGSTKSNTEILGKRLMLSVN